MVWCGGLCKNVFKHWVLHAVAIHMKTMEVEWWVLVDIIGGKVHIVAHEDESFVRGVGVRVCLKGCSRMRW